MLFITAAGKEYRLLHALFGVVTPKAECRSSDSHAHRRQKKTLVSESTGTHMSPFMIALRNLRTRLLPTLLTTLIIALGVGLAIGVIALSAGVKRGLITAGGPFEIVVGPKGSATQLVNSSILYQDVPIGNMSYAQYEALAQDPRVRDAVPLALGDNIRGLRIVGTTPALFRVAVTPDRPAFYRLVDGKPFASDFEAVLGSAAAKQLGMGIGATFASTHGTLAGVNQHEHTDFKYTVVGILAPTETPADLGVYVPLSSYWKVHGELRGSIFTPGTTVQDPAATNAPAVATGVTAVLVRGQNLNATYQIYNDLNNGRDLQAALPGAVLTQFLDLLGQGQRLLSAISALALGMAVLSMALALYNAMLVRRRETAVLRALGARRSTVVSIALCEALLQTLIGGVVGLALGHVAAAVIASIINQRSALAVANTSEPMTEAVILAILVVLGLCAGVLPAFQAYQIEAATALAGGA